MHTQDNEFKSYCAWEYFGAGKSASYFTILIDIGKEKFLVNCTAFAKIFLHLQKIFRIIMVINFILLRGSTNMTIKYMHACTYMNVHIYKVIDYNTHTRTYQYGLVQTL